MSGHREFLAADALLTGLRSQNRWDIFKVEVNKDRQVPVRLVRIDY